MNTHRILSTRKIKTIWLVTFLLLSVLVAVIVFRSFPFRMNVKHKDLDEKIKCGDTLRILTLYSSTSYFIYKGVAMGYEYELAARFAESLDIPYVVKVCPNTVALKEALIKGEGDLVAYSLPVTIEDREILTYCGRESITHQVIVQRKNRGDSVLKDVLDLKGKDVYVLDGSRYHERLINLNEEVGGGINIHLIDKDSVTTEELIEEVAVGIIPYTVADVHTAELNKTYFNNIDISLQISFSQRLSWAVNKDCPQLSQKLNEWFANNTTTSTISALTKRYFEQSKRPIQSPILSIVGNRISQYDDIFKEYAKGLGWDWRLLASIAYQESKFDTSQVSWAGAVGMMQLMPPTAAAFNLTPAEARNPRKSVDAATRFIRVLINIFKSIPDEKERVKFVLASYNAGHNHIFDAMALARKYGRDPHKWDGSVAQYVLWKSNPEYYNDPVVKFGYLRGNETFDYVIEVLDRYEYYKERIK